MRNRAWKRKGLYIFWNLMLYIRYIDLGGCEENRSKVFMELFAELGAAAPGREKENGAVSDSDGFGLGGQGTV